MAWAVARLATERSDPTESKRNAIPWLAEGTASPPFTFRGPSAMWQPGCYFISRPGRGAPRRYGQGSKRVNEVTIIPGLGLVVAGPIAGAIAGAGAGGATGTLLGALLGAGIPETRAAEYERGVKEGGIVLGTRAKDEAHATELERDFSGYGARNILR